MKSNSRRYQRHRNPETAEKKETPFFSPAEKAVQKKEDSAFFQPKLSVGQPGDSYEREADAVASKVVNKQATAGRPVQKKEISAVQRMPDEEVQAKSAPEKKEEEKKVQKKDGPEKKEEEKKVQKKEEEDVQMKSAPEKKEEEKKVQKKDGPEKKEEEKKVQKKGAPDKKEEEKPIQKKEEQEKKPAADEVLKEEKHAVQAKGNPGAAKQDTEGLSQQLKEQSGKGAKLAPEVRNEMSNAIGADFGGVNIHTGPKAAELSNELGAQAFTHGNDVYFNSGKYDADSSAGKHLLAHELTHVVQQGAAPAFGGSQSKGGAAPGVQRDMSTPLPEGVKPDKKSKVASFVSGDFKVEVKPDRKAYKGEEVDPEGATTKGGIAYGLVPKWTKDNKVEKVNITKKLIIETVYAAKVSAADKSEYGRGSLKKDKKEGHGTLGFHEGSHGTDFINYVKTHPFPEIVIESPVTEEEYKSLAEEWKTRYDAYLADMQKISVEKTDNAKDPVEE